MSFILVLALKLSYSFFKFKKTHYIKFVYLYSFAILQLPGGKKNQKYKESINLHLFFFSANVPVNFAKFQLCNVCSLLSSSGSCVSCPLGNKCSYLSVFCPL